MIARGFAAEPWPTHDRLEARRDDAAWFAAALRCDDVRAVVLTDDGLGERMGPLVGVTAPALVGLDAGGHVVVAVDATRGRNPAVRDAAVDVRPDRSAVAAHAQPSLALHALGLARWHSRTRFCSGCGAELVSQRAGHVLRCPADAVDHFPRLEPAMIVAVIDVDDRLLLGRARRWPPSTYSTLAGFVEPGETVEQACRREVLEESGVVVDEVAYVGSQPWPFPASLMLGLRASAATTRIVLDDELVDARWVTRPQLSHAMASGAIEVPPPLSIAHRLIEAWYGPPGQGRVPLRVRTR